MRDFTDFSWFLQKTFYKIKIYDIIDHDYECYIFEDRKEAISNEAY